MSCKSLLFQLFTHSRKCKGLLSRLSAPALVALIERIGPHTDLLIDQATLVEKPPQAIHLAPVPGGGLHDGFRFGKAATGLPRQAASHRPGEDAWLFALE